MGPVGRSARCLAFWLVLLFATTTTSPGASIAPETPPLRFHHLHYATGDPGSALDQYARRFGGTTVILQGLGVGVRVGNDEYVLVERGTASGAGGKASAVFDRAVCWLIEQGLAVESGAGQAVAAAADDAPLHVAFASVDVDATLRHLLARGHRPVGRTSESAVFGLPGGDHLEIVRETDSRELFWCPMHPDVKASRTASCSRCGMELVPIPPPQPGEYVVDAAFEPAAGGGARAVTVVIRDPASGLPVPSFETVHERQLHLFIIGRDLRWFAHVHPEPVAEGTFTLADDIPPGEYMLIADFLPSGGRPQLVQQAVVTPGYRGPLLGDTPPLETDLSPREVAGARVRVDAPERRAGRAAALRFTFEDAARGVPLEDLEPYLGAPAHLLLVSADLTHVVHAHPEEHTARGPRVTFSPLVPVPGAYKLWLQFQRHGRVHTAAFVVDYR